MPIFELNSESISRVKRTSFSQEGIKERNDLQRLLRDQIDLLAEDVMVLAEEFHDWADSNRSIDLLCLDTDARLVVVELKRTSDGGHMELQALRYAAMVSTMIFDQAVKAHEQYLQNRNIESDARTALLDFLGWEEPDEERFGSDVRIVLVSEGFSKEITTAVMWLNERDLNIRCVRLTPYNADGRVLLDIQQIIPLPEAEDFQIKIREKEQKKRSSVWKPKTMPAIWAEFESRCAPEMVSVARGLYTWLEDQFDEVFPTTNAFAPYLDDKSRNQFFFKVTYLGQVEIWFLYLAKKAPFESEDLREELRTRLNSIPGVEIPADRVSGKPKFPLEALVDKTALATFKKTVLWMLECTRSEDPA